MTQVRTAIFSTYSLEWGSLGLLLIRKLCTILEYRCHVYVRSDSLSCVVIADHDYPSRVCFTLMNKVWTRTLVVVVDDVVVDGGVVRF